MSLVGTRPPTVDEWDKYELHHRARLATKPGLTGMWQVSGRSNITDFEEVVKLDKQYISEWTIFFNYISLDRIAKVVDVLFYASCIAFFVRFANTFSLSALKQISFIDSSSPFESDMAQFFLLYCLYFFYTKQTWKSMISVILCFLCFKRFTLVMLIILLVINKIMCYLDMAQKELESYEQQWPEILDKLNKYGMYFKMGK